MEPRVRPVWVPAYIGMGVRLAEDRRYSFRLSTYGDIDFSDEGVADDCFAYGVAGAGDDGEDSGGYWM